MKSLRLAIGFLTVLPVAPGMVAQMGSARAYFPIVGLGLGAALAGLDIAAGQVLTRPVVGALLVVALIVLTGALHTEGFLDFCDGLFGGHSRRERLRILRDHHVGAFAVIGGVSLLLLKWALIVDIPSEERIALLLLFPCLSRLGMVSTMVVFPYARENGVGTSFQVGCSWWQAAFALATGAVASALFLGVSGVLLLIGALAVSLAVGRFVTGLLGGMTGDAYGAVNEVAEVAVLALGLVLLSVAPGFLPSPVG